jgi:hypothetical protein
MVEMPEIFIYMVRIGNQQSNSRYGSIKGCPDNGAILHSHVADLHKIDFFININYLYTNSPILVHNPAPFQTTQNHSFSTYKTETTLPTEFKGIISYGIPLAN